MNISAPQVGRPRKYVWRKPDNRKNHVKDALTIIERAKGIAPERAFGILTDLALTKKSMQSVADKWSESLGMVSAVQKMGRLAIKDIKEGMVAKNLMIANRALDAVHDRLSGPSLELEKTHVLAGIAKSSTDSALNLTQGQVGGGGTHVNIAIGDLRALHEREKRPSLKDQVEAQGIVVDALPECTPALPPPPPQLDDPAFQ